MLKVTNLLLCHYDSALLMPDSFDRHLLLTISMPPPQFLDTAIIHVLSLDSPLAPTNVDFDVSLREVKLGEEYLRRSVLWRGAFG